VFERADVMEWITARHRETGIVSTGLVELYLTMPADRTPRPRDLTPEQRNPYSTAYVAWLVGIVDSFEWRGESKVTPQVPEGFDAWFEPDKPPPVRRDYQALTREDLPFD